MNRSAFVSTAIPYVNAKPHVGFAMELIQADADARYLRLKGYDTFFLSGTDENSLKNVRAAVELGISVRELCNRNSGAFNELISGLNISCNDFIRTSGDIRHTPAAQKFWLHSSPGDIYKRQYEGYYCVGCEDFYAKDDYPNLLCPEHGTAFEFIKEENFFFRLSEYQTKLVDLLESGRMEVVPVSRKNEVLAFAKAGLKDFSISRTSARAGGWGIPVPGDPTQVIYVWYDALINYISALGYAGETENFRRYWLECGRRIHIIGKGINRFHTIYWPAMLLSAGLPLPDTIFIHGYLTVNGQKISKSLGNTISPLSQTEKFGVDPFRYYLLRAVTPFEDGDYSENRLREIYNADLANNMGNLVSRFLAMGERIQYFIPPNTINDVPPAFHKAMEDFRFNDALEVLWSLCDEMNRLFEINKPWDAVKEGRTSDVRTLLDNTVRTLSSFAYWLEPFLPATSEKLKRLLQPGQRVIRGNPIFPRIK